MSNTISSVNVTGPVAQPGSRWSNRPREWEARCWRRWGLAGLASLVLHFLFPSFAAMITVSAFDAMPSLPIDTRAAGVLEFEERIFQVEAAQAPVRHSKPESRPVI